MSKNSVKEEVNQVKEWRNFLLLGFVGLPVATFFLICGYGMFIWFMQIFFWGPPS